MTGPGRPSSYDPPRWTPHPWIRRCGPLMSDPEVLAHAFGRHLDQRIAVSVDGDLIAWTTASKQGVSLTIPPHALTGQTITRDAYLRWEARTAPSPDPQEPSP